MKWHLLGLHFIKSIKNQNFDFINSKYRSFKPVRFIVKLLKLTNKKRKYLQRNILQETETCQSVVQTLLAIVCNGINMTENRPLRSTACQCLLQLEDSKAVRSQLSRHSTLIMHIHVTLSHVLFIQRMIEFSLDMKNICTDRSHILVLDTKCRLHEKQ